jgi:thioredoxin 1
MSCLLDDKLTYCDPCFRRIDSVRGAGLQSEPVRTHGCIHFREGLGKIMGHAAEFTDAGFEEDVIQSDSPVLVDFWAPWCGPCRQIAPLIDELALQYEGKVKIGKVNVDDNPETAQRFDIMNIPTLLLFKNGEVAERFIGLPPRSKLEAALTTA